MNVTSRSAGLPSRILLFFLVALLLFASYRPAIHLLFLASLALDDNDSPSQLAPIKNLPRPTRQQLRTAIPRVVHVSKSDASPGGSRRPSAPVARPVSNPDSPLVRALRTPEYLRPVEAHIPYNHLSPPV